MNQLKSPFPWSALALLFGRVLTDGVLSGQADAIYSAEKTPRMLHICTPASIR